MALELERAKLALIGVEVNATLLQVRIELLEIGSILLVEDLEVLAALLRVAIDLWSRWRVLYHQLQQVHYSSLGVLHSPLVHSSCMSSMLVIRPYCSSYLSLIVS